MFRGTQLGFGARSFQYCAGIFQKCWERLTSACPDGPTDGCCAVVQCEWCVFITPQDDPRVSGVVEWNDSGDDAGKWTGQVGNYAFEAYWQRDAEGQCWLYIVINDDTAGRLELCYDVECRDPEGSLTATIDGEVLFIEWFIRKPIELPLREEDGCIVNFCGQCDCVCRELCATLTYPNGDICRGEIGPATLEPDRVVWTGTLECADESTVEVTVYMERDIYTSDCILYAYADGELTDEVVVDDCTMIDETLYIGQNHSLHVVCLECDCDLSCDGGCTWGSVDGEWVVLSRPGCVAPCSCCGPPNFAPECDEQLAACGCWNPFSESIEICGETGLCQTTICPEA